MPDPFPIITIPAAVERRQEQTGTKFKFWYRDDVTGLHLYKQGHPNTGEDWAEVVVAQLCKLLRVPHAEYQFAFWNGNRGVISDSIYGGNEGAELGNELLNRLDNQYPRNKRIAREHTVKRIVDAFNAVNIRVPIEPFPIEFSDGSVSAGDIFLGYLMLDAWVGNTDRHHENWGLVRRLENEKTFYRLAPSHDHAASLGCILRDEEAHERLTTRDRGRTIEHFVERARSAIFVSETDAKPLGLIEAFQVASTYYPEASKIWLSRLEGVNMAEVTVILDRVPDVLITPAAREFALRMLEINRRRLLEQR